MPVQPRETPVSLRLPKLMLKLLQHRLETGNPAATLDRLFTSQHVNDLQLIAGFTLTAVALAAVIGFPLSVLEDFFSAKLSPLSFSHLVQVAIRILPSATASFLTFFGPALAVLGAVLAWVYQTGSARLGVVDLFACEISTLCKVVTVVDVVSRYIGRFDHSDFEAAGQTEPSHPQEQGFTSQESYFTIFEAGSRDLQNLEARVVINITAFYTYMKAVRDSQRRLSTSPRASGDTARNLVYMLFLALESARLAIDDLVEFQPERAERKVVILISELPAYGFLCSQFPDEQSMYRQRLSLRSPAYKKVLTELNDEITKGMHSDAPDKWEPSYRLLPTLNERYDAATKAADQR
jgi:hypothetical protein